MSNMRARLSRVLQKMSSFSSPVVRWLLSGRVHGLMSRQLLLVTFTGRTTGRSYTTPVSYVRDANELLVPGGGRWWKNLGSGPVSVRLQGSQLPVAPEVISEPIAVREMLARMMAANPAVSIFTGIARGSDGLPVSHDLARARQRGFVVVRLHLIEVDAEVKVA